MTTPLLLLSLATCGLDASTTGSLATIGGQVTDTNTYMPMPGVLIAIYAGSWDAAAVVSQAGDPNYVYSTATDDAGMFSLALLPGSYTIQAFAPGYRCAIYPEADASTDVALTPLAASDLPPTISGPTFDPERVIPTYPATFTAQVAAGDPNDPLSHQVFLMNPGTSFILPLDAPGPAIDGNHWPRGAWPNGAWTRSFAAPTTTGDFNMRVVVASENCVCGFATSSFSVAR